MARRVLVVDSVDSYRDAGRNALAAVGFEVEWAADGADGFELMMAMTYDLVVIDCELKRLDGPALVAKLRGHGVKTPILVWATTANSALLEATLKLTGGVFVDKAQPIDQMVKHVDALINGHAVPAASAATAATATATATPKPCQRLVDKTTSGGVLVIDERDSDVESIRSMLPSSLYFDGCKTANDGMARAHDHKFDLALFNADDAVTNLTGLLAQFHLLLPDGFVVAVANTVHGENLQQIAKTLGSYDFDDVTFKPLKTGDIDKLLNRYCSSWNDLVVVSDDVVRASARRARREQYKTFACNLKTRLEEGIRALSDACFERAIVDVSAADSVTTMDMAEILRRLTASAKPLGLSARFVCTPSMIAAIRKCEASFGWDALKLFPSVDIARAEKE